MWKHFPDISVGASLDAMGPRAELMRKGTKWEETLANRKRMMEVCPKVDFYISSTVGILNAHGGDLSKYRGNACQAWAILNGEKKSVYVFIK